MSGPTAGVGRAVSRGPGRGAPSRSFMNECARCGGLGALQVKGRWACVEHKLWLLREMKEQSDD